MLSLAVTGSGCPFLGILSPPILVEAFGLLLDEGAGLEKSK